MVEFAHREALLMRTDALTASRRARKKRFLTGFAYQDDAPVAGEALAVSRRMRGRNLLRAAKLFGAAFVAVVFAGLLAAFLSHGIDVSPFVPSGLFEFVSSAHMPVQSVLQPNLADFGSVQSNWWEVPKSVIEYGKAVYPGLRPLAPFIGTGFVLWAAMIGLRPSKKSGSAEKEREPEI